MRFLTAHWLRLGIPVLCLLSVVGLLVAPIGMGSSQWERTLNDAAHAPLFALAALVALYWLRRFANLSHIATYSAAFLLAVMLGAAGEAAQWFGGARQAQWHDLVNDGVGALAALSIRAAFDASWALSLRVRLLWLFVAGAGIVFAVMPTVQSARHYLVRWQQLPALVDWRSDDGYHFVSAVAAQVLVTAPPAPWRHSGRNGSCELSMYVQPGAGGDEATRYAGITIEEPWPDWSMYSAVQIELVNPNEVPAKLTLRIDDRAHNNRQVDRLNMPLSVAPKTRELFTVPMATVRDAPRDRDMDLTRIAKLILFQDAERGAVPLYVCAVTLVK
jgi:VanZ family protein